MMVAIASMIATIAMASGLDGSHKPQENLQEKSQKQDCAEDFICQNYISIFNKKPKYGENSPHFEYVNPVAPKVGAIRFASSGTYDNFNPFILKGMAVTGVSYIYDSLMSKSSDEIETYYPLLAKSLDIHKSQNMVIFHLNPLAKWHNGKAVTAEDVEFSFNILKTEGHPNYRSILQDVLSVRAISPLQVQFDLAKSPARDILGKIVSINILPKEFYEGKDFAKPSLEIPLGSGAYRVKSFDVGRSVTYERVRDYWGAEILVNKGRNNFDEIKYDYYLDENIAIEAFKAGEYDLRLENIARMWAKAYDIKPVKTGGIIKEEIAHALPTGMQAFIFNQRRGKFSDIRLRQAIGLAFDFEWTNKTLFYDAYQRTRSYFSNSVFASDANKPAGKVKDMLHKMKQEFPQYVPDEALISGFAVPKTSGRYGIRDNLLQARKLLMQAGYQIKDGSLVNESGKKLEIEFLTYSPAFERVILPVINNLKRLGIKARMRKVDASQYVKRIEERDFDIIVSVLSSSLSPGQEVFEYFHSSRADIMGSNNLGGIKNEACDFLIEKILQAKTIQDIKLYTKTLDRILLFNHYVVPNWHLGKYRLAYWNKFGKPAISPKYSLNLNSWWLDTEKQDRKHLKKEGK